MANPKIFISAGCSFTEYPQDKQIENWRLKKREYKNWPWYLSEYLDCGNQSFYLGRGSADNNYIANTTLHTLSKFDKNFYDQILVGVMWSGINRMSFYLSDKPESYTHFNCDYNPNGYINKNYYFVGPFWNDELAKLYYKNYYDDIGNLIQTLKNMILLQNFLKLNNIKYFFTEYSYDCVSENKLLENPEVTFFYNFLDKSNFLPVSNMSHWIDNNTSHAYYIGDKHPTPIMSKDFTDQVIIPYLKSKGYIE